LNGLKLAPNIVGAEIKCKCFTNKL